MRLLSVSEFAGLLLLALYLVRVEASYYYELLAHVTLSGGGLEEEAIVGDFASYSNNNENIIRGHLALADGTTLGCIQGNATLSIQSGQSIVFLGLTEDCNDYQLARNLREVAAAVVFYYTPSSRRKSLGSRPSNGPALNGIAIIELDEDFAAVLKELRNPQEVSVTLEGIYHQYFQTSRTFYFVVFAFCILMVLSCLWFGLSYLRRCRYNISRQRNSRAHSNTTAQKVIDRLPVRIHKESKDSKEEETICVVCLEAFQHKDTIRTLPCRHEFHKKCVDPWLKIKRTCPVCKQSILEERQASTSNLGTSTRDSAPTHGEEERIIEQQRPQSPDRETFITMEGESDP